MLKKLNGAVIHSPDWSKPAEPLVITGGRVIDPANRIDETLAIAVRDGRIASVSKEIPKEFSKAKTIDAQGKWVVPGLMDMHTHLREPGREDKETIETGTQAAAAGGFTAVA
jgi:dihydroorotase